MKKLLLGIVLISSNCFLSAQTPVTDTAFLQPVEVSSIRANDNTPVAKSLLTKKEIQANNIGQDLPFILNQTPSVIVNSDAGNGIGYTGIRIRGSDASRINVTLNGIPYNDAESQGTFFVDLPDIASSASSIQIQRGVGTSSNGAGAFGGSINVSTNDINTEQSLQFNNSAGSYESFKNTLAYSSGIFGKHFLFDGRFSNIRSEGYIDRASTRLRSGYASFAFVNAKTSLRFNFISGKEKTYQAWYGIDEATLQTNRRYNSAGTEKPGTPYDNETDNYTQTHYQLFYNHKFTNSWKASAAAYLTRGLGYYEQYRAGESLDSYGLPILIQGTDTTTNTDLIRRLWLDNYFYGFIFSAQHDNAKRQVIIGGGANEYDGGHYGKIISATVQAAVPQNYRWYNNDAVKKEASLYTKWNEKITANWHTFIDLQVRAVNYKINGFRDNPELKINQDYFFFNPKAGITYTQNKTTAYFSFARAGKEPNRDDFEAGKNQQPKAEKLNDFEAGLARKDSKTSIGANLFYMDYKNQLVLTGQINDVGAYTRTNIPASYRAGIELEGKIFFNKYISAGANLTLSENKLKNFTEFIDDYDNGGQQTKLYKKADIAYSPNTIFSATVNILPVKNTEINLVSKYVGGQFLDNTSDDARKLKAYYTQDVRASYSFKNNKINDIKLYVQVTNLFSKRYEPNGYTFSYFYGGNLTTENYYFPMAPLNVTAGINISL